MFPAIKDLKEMSDSDGIQYMNHLFMGGMSVANEISSRCLNRLSVAASKEDELTKAMACLNKAKALYEEMEFENKKLKQAATDGERVRQALTESYDKLLKDSDSLRNRVLDLEREVSDTQLNSENLSSDRDRLSRAVEHLNSLLAEKSSELELVSSEKDLKMKGFEDQLSVLQSQVEQGAAAVRDVCEEKFSLEKELASCKEALSAVVGDRDWLLRTGIATCFRHILHSSEFSQLNGALQRACVEFGLHKACQDTKNKYSAQLEGLDPVYSYDQPSAKARVRLSELRRGNYSLLNSLAEGSVGVEGLKKLASDVASSSEGGGVSQV